MLHAGLSELRRAFYAHLGVAQGKPGGSHYLLLFYAAECGLKMVFLRRSNIRTTERLRDEVLQHGHQLDRWIKELHLPAHVIAGNMTFRLNRDQSTHCHVSTAHEAWRYGLQMHAQDEKSLVEWLENLCEWVKRAE